MRQSHIRKMIIQFLKRGGQWLDFEGDDKPKWKFIFQICRIIFITGNTIANAIAIYLAGFEESLKGMVIFFPIGIILTSHAFIFSISQQELVELLDSFEICFLQLEHEWEKKIFNRHHYRLWKMLNIYEIFMMIACILYFTFPFIFDLLLNSFGILNKPYNVPLPLGGYMNSTRDFNYYVIILMSLIWGISICFSHVGFLGIFCIFIVYTCAFMEIFTRKVKSCDTSALNPLIDRHKRLLRLSRNVKLLFGLPCAIQSSFVSACLCLCLFVVTTTDDAVVFVAYTFGILLYIYLGFLFCILGQLLENESSRIFEALYAITWYTCNPKVRKDINMMIRQARQPLRIDYKGRSAMNLHTYMQVLHTSYTYFMLLQHVTK